MRFSGLNSYPSNTSDVSTWQVCVILLLALLTYVYGLGGQYVPTIGDEMVYAHIARLTAESGQWLPLASELPGTRNTKPPLLFWQAMMAGDWGRNWTLQALRAPSLIYTFLLAACVAASTRLISRSWRDGLLAACLFLVFFSTFRFGRPYLTSAPETFWLSLPLFLLLWQRLRTPNYIPGWQPHVLLGLGLGLGLAYKSFALIAPAAAAWWLALIWSEPHPTWPRALRHTLLTGFSAAVALSVFALWFVLDPSPQEVWQEFILAENAAKFSDRQGYWQQALSLSGSSIWSQLLAYPVNAGLLFFVVLGLGWRGMRSIGQLDQKLPAHQIILLAWALVWLAVFLFPSQRTARYVIPAMPAIAILLALNWRHLARFWYLPTLLLAVAMYVYLGRIAWVAYTLGLYSVPEVSLITSFMVMATLVALLALIKPAWTRTGALLANFLVYAGWGLTVAPMDGAIGRFNTQAQGQLPNGTLAAPSNFNGQFERYQFLLDKAQHIQPYGVDALQQSGSSSGEGSQGSAQLLGQLLTKYAAVVWVQDRPLQTQPPCLPGCKILGERWILRSRYLSGEITAENVWHPDQWLFRREWLLTRGD